MIDFVSSSIELSVRTGATAALGKKGWSLKTEADIKLVRTTIKAKNTKTNPIPKRVKLIASLSKLLSIIDIHKKLILWFKF
jgi:lambda repressor-like predicted transcriptional regulator